MPTQPLDFVADIAIQKTRLAAVAPYLNQSQYSVVLADLRASASWAADIRSAVIDSAPDIAYTTATGIPLMRKASDYNVNPSAGIAASDMVVYYTQTAPTAAQGAIFIPTGSLVGTSGNTTNVPQVWYTTEVDATIAVGATTCGAPIPVVCTAPGIIGNVSPGSINTTELSGSLGVMVSNATTVAGISNPNGGNHTSSSPNTLGVDPDGDPQLRDKIATRATPLTGVANTLAAILAVPGVYDAWIYDPTAWSTTPTGYIYYYWSAQDGTTPGIPAGAATAISGMPANPTYFTNPGGFSGLAASVDLAVRGFKQGGIIARAAADGTVASAPTTTPFQIVNLTSITYTYRADPSLQSTVLEPLINQSIQAYIQGGSTGVWQLPGLVHGQLPTVFGMSDAVTKGTGYSLQNFTLTTTTPPIPSTPPVQPAGLNVLYRATAPTFFPTRNT